MKDFRLLTSDYLDRNQLKHILGGNLPGPIGCCSEGGNGTGTQCVNYWNLGDAEDQSVSNGGTHYCCDSCCTASWLSPAFKYVIGC